MASARAAAALVAALALALAVGACSLVATPPDGVAVPPGPLAPVIAHPEGGPPVECRGVPRDQCLGLTGPGQWDAVPDAVRLIVTCTGVCTPAQGDVSVDALLPGGRIRNLGGAGYAAGG